VVTLVLGRLVGQHLSRMENCVLRMGGGARWSTSGPLMIGRENPSHARLGQTVMGAGRLIWRLLSPPDGLGRITSQDSPVIIVVTIIILLHRHDSIS
jgi:hypothetical protein